LERADDIDAEDPLEVGGVERIQIAMLGKLRDAGIVDQAIDAAPFVQSRLG
jgi:hypothetical protein